MANREALRELQTRLAQRLQAARSEGPVVSWLAIEVGAGRYLLPLAHSGEIFSFASAQKVPYTQPWFLGVANLRGGLYGVVDLAAFLSASDWSQAPAAPVRADVALGECSLVALNSALEMNCVLVVDQLLGLRQPSSFQNYSPPVDGAPAFLGGIYADAQGAVWQELNLVQLARGVQFLSIGA